MTTLLLLKQEWAIDRWPILSPPAYASNYPAMSACASSLFTGFENRNPCQ
ncbi:MAG: hypothetical protein H6Q97_552 [Nitrospirae bacterium]|jgi:hypothetical protein|nr:hypothetical protein [Nitrospirota bacterium]